MKVSRSREDRDDSPISAKRPRKDYSESRRAAGRPPRKDIPVYEEKNKVAVDVRDIPHFGVTSATATQDGQTVTTITDPTVEGKAPTHVTPKLAIFNMPSSDDLPDEYVHALLQQFGTPINLHLVKDPNTGVRTCGFFDFLEGDSAGAVCIRCLNGMFIGGQIIRLTRLEQASDPMASSLAAGGKNALGMANLQGIQLQTMTSKILSNPFVAKRINYGREIGTRPSQVVGLLNCVTVEDLYDEVEYKEIVQELQEDAGRFGVVEQFMIPRPSQGHGSDAVGKVFVCFHDTTSARRYQLEMNGRKFDNRVICASFYPYELFKKGKYTLS